MKPAMHSKVDISILIAEDHRLFSEGVKIVLENTQRFGRIHQAKNGLEAVSMALKERPSVILMDIMTPEMDGIEAAMRVKQGCPGTKIVMLTSLTDTASVRKALSSGVDGYCSKDTDFKRLIMVIDMVLQGAIYLDPAIAQFVLSEYFREPSSAPSSATRSTPPSAPLPEHSRHEGGMRLPGQSIDAALLPPDRRYCETDHKSASENRSPPLSPSLTPSDTPLGMPVLQPRELRILTLIAENRTNVEIARVLGLSPAWINHYIQAILVRLSAESEIQAVKKALENGTITTAPILDQEYLE